MLDLILDEFDFPLRNSSPSLLFLLEDSESTALKGRLCPEIPDENVGDWKYLASPAHMPLRYVCLFGETH